MLISFSVKNFYSFDDEVKFELAPQRSNRLNHHRYKSAGIEALKMAALYGANGAGKSNLIRALDELKQLVIKGKISPELIRQKFKLCDDCKQMPIVLRTEFVKDGLVFMYEIEILDLVISSERLSTVDRVTPRKNVFLFTRRTENKTSQVQFFPEFYKNDENRALANLIEKTLLKPNQPLLNFLGSLDKSDISKYKSAYLWFEENLEVISPNTKPIALPHMFDLMPTFEKFANNMICSFSTGVSSLAVSKAPIENYPEIEKKEIEEISSKLLADPERIALLDSNTIVVNDNGRIVTKRLLLYHNGYNGKPVMFDPLEESDGTIRLLEYIPAIKDLIDEEKVYIIDEIERSIHPLTIKEIIAKFSLDDKTKGQLIFSTHEVNLLDQDIFRQDEIWFVEKNDKGASRIYSLGEFREHHTLDIRKGYLMGRYNAIPFLGNLRDLNWHKE